MDTSGTAAPSTPAQLPTASVRLFQAGLLLFVITIVIGILNGTDLVDFDRNTLLTHVHAGTLGWLTTAIVGAAIWMFRRPGEDPQQLAMAVIVATAIYVVAFWTGNATFRPIAGTLMFGVVVWVLVWVGGRAEGATLDIPRFAMVFSLVTLTIGAVLGILLGLAIQGRASWVPNGVAESHPPTMVIGYLVLAALGLVEWQLTGGQAKDAVDAVAAGRPPRLGQAQVLLVFLAGLLLILGIIFEVEALLMVSAPVQIAGIGIFVKRLWQPLRAIGWSDRDPARHLGATAFFLVANTVLLLYLVGSSGGDVDKIDIRLILALDHMMFLGVLTNALFAIVRRAVPTPGEVADDVAFWGVNVGLGIFVLGLFGDWAVLKQVGTPILGLALLHAIAVTELRLQRLGARTG